MRKKTEARFVPHQPLSSKGLLRQSQGADQCLKAAHNHAALIEGAVRRLISTGRFEPDGSILVRTSDI
jgi:hypothetical protein